MNTIPANNILLSLMLLLLFSFSVAVPAMVNSVIDVGGALADANSGASDPIATAVGIFVDAIWLLMLLPLLLLVRLLVCYWCCYWCCYW